MRNAVLLSVPLALWMGVLSAQEPQVTTVQIRSVNACSTTACRQVQAVVEVTDADEASIIFSDPLRDHFAVCERTGGEQCMVEDFDVTLTGSGGGLTVGLVIDRSGSMGSPDMTKMNQAKEAARQFVSLLRPADRVALWSFSNGCRLDQDFIGGDAAGKAALNAAINALVPSGGTAFYGCICNAVDRIVREPGEVKAVVALTDGWENESDLPCARRTDPLPRPTDLLCAHVEPLGVPVYPIGFGEGEEVAEEKLQEIAECTGGSLNLAPTGPEIEALFLELLEDLRTQYLIEYCSTCFPAASGQIDVEICAGEAPVGCEAGQVCGLGSYTLRAPPEIERSPETILLSESTQPAGVTLTICATITSAVDVVDARLFYRRVDSGAAFVDVPLADQGGDLWCVTIPADEVVDPGIEYFISASDGLCTVTDPGAEPEDDPYQIPVEPRTPPVLGPYTPPDAYCPGEPIAVAVEVSDDTGSIVAVEVFYRRVGLIQYASTSLEAEGDSGRWSGFIPGSAVQLPGIEYYVKACDDTRLCDYIGNADNPLRLDVVGDFCGGGPDADAGGPYRVSCPADAAIIQLDGTVSIDSAGGDLTYKWTSDCPGATWDDDASATPVLTLDASDTALLPCSVTLTVTNEHGQSDADEAVVYCGAEDCAVAVADPSTCWPPNHRFTVVKVLGVLDPSGSPAAITVNAITQDEPVLGNGQGSGRTCPDAILVDLDEDSIPEAAAVRCERDGTGDGRVYRIQYTADGSGDWACEGSVDFCVPHDRRGEPCTDSGRTFDSTVCPEASEPPGGRPAEPRRGEGIEDGDETESFTSALLMSEEAAAESVPEPHFLRGDVDWDERLRIADAVLILRHLFPLEVGSYTGLSCLDAGDVNDDGAVNITDAVFLLLHLYRGGSSPPAPTELGPDPTLDALGCD